MRKIVDDKLNYTLYEDLFESDIKFPLLNEIYMSHCISSDEPDRMELSYDAYEYLATIVFKDHPEFAIYRKFHNATIILCHPLSKEIRFTKINPTKIPRLSYKMNATIRYN